MENKEKAAEILQEIISFANEREQGEIGVYSGKELSSIIKKLIEVIALIGLDPTISGEEWKK